MPKGKSTMPQKPPVPLVIKTHDGERSPHILNLRTTILNAQKNSTDTDAHNHRTPISFEQRVAAFDERVKDVPDIVRGGAEHFANFFEEQRSTWQESVSTFLEKAAVIGTETRKKLGTTAGYAAKRIKNARRNSRSTRFIFSKISFPLPHIFKHEQLGFFILALVMFTIPLQGILIYQTIQQTQNSARKNMADLQIHGGSFLTALQSRDIAQAQKELTLTLLGMKGLREAVDHLGIVRLFLPARVRDGITALKLVEISARSGERLLEKIIDIQNGADTPASLIYAAHSEITLLNQHMKHLLEDPKWGSVIAPMYDRLKNIDDALGVLSYFAGENDERRILLVFENPRELRATGGFLGSIALLSIRNGTINTFEVPQGGSYDFQGQLTLRAISPEPLHLINARFELQDANWWPDFPTSARKIAELYESAGGETLDGIVGITASVGESLLKKTGPLRAPGLNLTADTFIDTLQDAIATDRAVNRKTPKKIITQLFPLFKDETIAFARKEPSAAFGLLLDAFARKDIQVWSRDEVAQAALRRLGFAGMLSQTSGDYLAVISSNVGGGKTDGVIRETIRHRATIARKGVRTTLTITRAHDGARGDERTGVRNVSYIRVYVPQKARFISARGFTAPSSRFFEHPDDSLTPDTDVRTQEISMQTNKESGTRIWREGDKTVFGNWLIVDPGKEIVGEITYEVPSSSPPPTRAYTLTIDPQAGAQAHLTSEVNIEPDLKLIAGEGRGTWEPSGWKFDGPLEKTVIASGVFYQL